MDSSRRMAPRPSQPSRPTSAGILAGLAKCIGAGLRLAYVVAPDAPAAWSFNSAMRALCVMASPISAAVATRWINDGTADTILRFIRSESIARERIAANAMEPGSYLSDPLSFNIWLPMRNGWTRSVFVSQARASGLGVVPSDAFAANGAPPEAVRVGLGGPITRSQVERGLAFLSHLLERQPESVAT